MTDKWSNILPECLAIYRPHIIITRPGVARATNSVKPNSLGHDYPLKYLKYLHTNTVLAKKLKTLTECPP